MVFLELFLIFSRLPEIQPSKLKPSILRRILYHLPFFLSTCTRLPFLRRTKTSLRVVGAERTLAVLDLTTPMVAACAGRTQIKAMKRIKRETWDKMKEYCWCHHKFKDDIKCWHGGIDKAELCDYDRCPILNK